MAELSADGTGLSVHWTDTNGYKFDGDAVTKGCSTWTGPHPKWIKQCCWAKHPHPHPGQPTPAPGPAPPSPKKHGTHHVGQGDYCGKISVEECGAGTPCTSFADCPAICNSATVCPGLQVGDDVKFDCSLKGTYC